MRQLKKYLLIKLLSFSKISFILVLIIFISFCYGVIVIFYQTFLRVVWSANSLAIDIY